jgi:hypothetical protein
MLISSTSRLRYFGSRSSPEIYVNKIPKRSLTPFFARSVRKTCPSTANPSYKRVTNHRAEMPKA